MSDSQLVWTQDGDTFRAHVDYHLIDNKHRVVGHSFVVKPYTDGTYKAVSQITRDRVKFGSMQTGELFTNVELAKAHLQKKTAKLKRDTFRNENLSPLVDADLV